MKDLARHRGWILSLVLALSLGAGGGVLCDIVREHLENNIMATQDEKRELQDLLKQRRDDAATPHLEGTMDAQEIDDILAPTDRSAARRALESLAQAAGFTSFAFTLAPEEPARLEAAGTEDLRESRLTFKIDDSEDRRFYRFLEQLDSILPGQLRLQSLTIQHLPPESPPLRMEAAYVWVANKAKDGGEQGISYPPPH